MNSIDKEVLKDNSSQTRNEIDSKIGKTVRTVQTALDKLKEANKIV